MFIVALDSCQILFLLYLVAYITAKRTFLYAKLTEMLCGEVAVFVSCAVGYSHRPDLNSHLSKFMNLFAKFPAQSLPLNEDI